MRGYSKVDIWGNELHPMDPIDGHAGDKNIVGTPTRDIVYANGGRDVIYTGAGDDTIYLNADNVNKLGQNHNRGGKVDGGSGFDSLVLTEDASVPGGGLDFSKLNNGAIKGIERIDLGSGANWQIGNTLSLKTTDVFHILDPSHHQLFIDGGPQARVDLTGFTFVTTTFVSANGFSGTYDVYTWGSGGLEQLLVNDSIVAAGHVTPR
jgi:Ca2+-binding RTX toxin-like protein